MTSTVEIRVLELLCSRLCHELISPVSAISNGVELMSDDPGDMLGEIISLLTLSSSQASQRLKFYRIAYGLGGEAADSMGLADAGTLVKGIVEEVNIDLSWPDGTEVLGRAAIKILLNAALMAVEALPRGGEISVAISGSGGTAQELTLTASGEGAKLWEESIAALDPAISADNLTPRSVQAYFTRFLAEAAGGSFRHDSAQDGRVVLTAQLPETPNP